MEEEKGGANNVSTRSKRITKDNKAPAVRGGRKGGDEDAEESQGEGKDKGKRTKERSIEEII